MAAFAAREDVDKAKSKSWLESAQESTDAWLSNFGYGNGPKAVAVVEPPAMDIKLPTKEEWHAAAPWRDMDPPKQLPSTPSGTPAAMPSNAPRTGAVGSSMITTGDRSPALRPGESANVQMADPDPNSDDEQWARSEARRLGIDPEKAVQVGNTEGGFKQRARQNMQGSPAYSPYQLYIGGSDNPGLGDEALAAGIDPRDPNQSHAAITFALEHAAKNGWRAFQGAAAAGIGDWDGIRGQAAPQAQQQRSGPMPEDAPNGGRQTAERPTQFAEGLSWDEAIAACGLAGVSWFTAKTGRTPKTVAEVKQAAQVSNAWDAQNGMHGIEATARLMRDEYGIAATVVDGVDFERVRRDVQSGNPVMFDTDSGSAGHYYTVSGARQRADGQWEYDLGTSATDLKASGGKRWYTESEIPGLGFGRPYKTVYMDNPQSPAPSPTAGRQSLNTGDGPPPPESPVVASAGDSSSPGTGPETAWSPDSQASPDRAGPSFQGATGRSGGAGTMFRAPLSAAPQEVGNDGQPTSTYNDPDAGGTITQLLPYNESAPVGADGAGAPNSPSVTPGVPSSPNIVLQPPGTPPTPNGNWEPVQTIPNPQRPPATDPGEWLANDSHSTPAAPEPPSAWQTAQNTASNVGSTLVEAGRAGVNAFTESATRLPTIPEALQTPAPDPIIGHGIRASQAAASAAGDVVGRRVLEGFGGDPTTEVTTINVPGYGPVVVTAGDVAGLVGQAVLDPGNLVGGGEARTAGRAAVEAVKPVVREAGSMAARGARALGEEGARQLMDLTPSPRMMQAGEGGGEAARRAERLTVEQIQDRIDRVTELRGRARAEGDAALDAKAGDVLAELSSDLVDARNARLNLEPAITSDVGRRAETLPQTEARAERTLTRDGQTGFSGQPARPDELSGPMSVPTDMAGRQNAIMPFDPASTALGAGAGTETDENGNPVGVDPLRAAAGMAMGAVVGTPQGKRLVMRAARGAKQAAPPNLLEIMQGIRFSWGMLGNFAGGVVNASGAPIEIGLGVPSEAFRMGVLHQRPAATIYQWVETLAGLKQGVRDMLGTVIGQVPASVRNSPDFRPPLNERMQGTGGKIAGHIIEAPGRLATQVPDALWAPVFTRQGRAIEAGNIMAENGVSRLRPDQQVKEMHRLLYNPTPSEAKRIDAAAKTWQEEMQYKGKPGYIEGQINNLVRGSADKVATANDPIEKQVHEALGSFAMPFFGTLWKQYKLAASRVPVTNFLTNRSLPLDQKISRSVVGAGLGLYLIDRAASGLITGPGPSDPDEAALVNKDMPPLHSYVPGMGWVPNAYFGSAAPYLNAVGGYYDARRYATDKEKASGDKMGDATAKSMLRAFAQFPIAQAVQNFITMAESPTKGSTDAIAGTASSIVPSPLKTYLGSQDTKVRTTDREAGFVDQLGQKLEARTGIGRQSLPAAQDRFGRDVENPRQGAAAFGLNVKQSQNDPVVAAFREAGVELGMPKREITIETVPGAPKLPAIPLSPKEQRDWNRERGSIVLEQTRKRLDSPEFKAMPPERRTAVLEFIRGFANKTADDRVQSQIGTEEIKRRIREAQSQKKAS